MSATLRPYTQMPFLAGIPDRISAAIRQTFTGRGAAKRIARAAEAEPRTASAWLYGQNAPRSAELVALMAENDALEQQIWALVHELREKKSCPTNGLSASALGAGSTSQAIPNSSTVAG